MYFIAVLVPQTGGGWRVHFPDLPGCGAEGNEVEIAIDHASRAVTAMIGKLPLSGGLPPPRSFEEIRTDETWAAELSIDWAFAVVSLVQLPDRK
jgi:predicted RNase H-like HicB family nuclease